MLLKRLFFKIRLPLAIVILFFVAIFIFPFPTIGKTILLAMEVTPQIPLKPMKFLTRAPIVETVKIKTSKGEVAADLYRPRDGRSHPAAIFTLGIAITKEDGEVVGFSDALARSGFVVLTPNLPDFISGFVWTDSVDTLVSSVLYLDKQSFVDKTKIGFAGFCVGASASIIAAEDPKIASKVNFITAISPYYDLIDLSKAVVTNKAEDKGGNYVDWVPAGLTTRSVQLGFINYLSDENEKNQLKDYFVSGTPISDKEHLSQEAIAVYGFLSTGDRDKQEILWKDFPQSGKDMLRKLSPSTKIGDLRAKLLILNDKKDTFVPKIEGERLGKSLSKGQIYFSEIDSLEHVSPKTKLPRWAAIRQFVHLGVFLYNVLSQVS